VVGAASHLTSRIARDASNSVHWRGEPPCGRRSCRASRLYRAALVTLAVTGLLLLDARPTQARVAPVLPARAHDALNRLLRTLPCSTRALMTLLMVFVQRLDQRGYLIVDNVIVEKAYARRLP
jgi:hypothetical protein